MKMKKLKIKRKKWPYVSFRNYEEKNGKFVKKKFIHLRTYGKKALFVIIFLGLGHWMDFPNILTLKNFGVMILSAVTLFLYDEFGWTTDLSDVYDIKLEE